MQKPVDDSNGTPSTTSSHLRKRSHGSMSSIYYPRSSEETVIDGLDGLSSPRDYDLESSIAGDSDHDAGSPRPVSKTPGQATWMSLPRKDQLLILFLCRMVDFLQVACVQTYVFYQLRSLDPELSDAQISSQAGVLQGAFTGAQVLTAILWGKAADASWCGRKLVLVIGLFGTGLTCIGYGFASSFYWAMFWRALGGAINGLVGIIRTMISEITVEKKYQSRAFLILPIGFNVANFLGPIMGGGLADPAKTLPGIFGPGAPLAYSWVNRWPYALPSLLNALFMCSTGVLVFFFLEETSKTRRGRFDPGLYVVAWVKSFITRTPMDEGYAKIRTAETLDIQPKWAEDNSNGRIAFAHKSGPIRRLPFSRIWTRNVVFTLIMEALFDFHLGAFTNIWTLFLSTPRALERSLPFKFAGGMGMPASTVGGATSILGILGMSLQIFLYPRVQGRLGTLRSFRWFLLLFPIAYIFAPYLAVLPSTSPPPEPASGSLIWICIVLLLLVHTSARTMTLPASIILLNNCSPHPSVLGTIHGLGQSVSAGFRTVGPIVGGSWYGASLDMGMVGASWWAVAGMSILCCCAAMFIYEGSGHEIYLEGEEYETVEMMQK